MAFSGTRVFGVWIAGLLACLVTGPAALGQCEVSMRESNYWFVAPEVDQSHGDQPLYMRITSYDDPVDIRLSMPANGSFTPITASIPPFSFHTIDLTPFKATVESSPYNSVLDNGILLELTGVASVYYEVAHRNNPAIFNLKGDVALGEEFMIPSQTAYPNHTSKPGREGFIIVATEDDTDIEITPNNDLVGRSKSAGPFTIRLDRGQTWAGVATGPYTSDRLFGTEIEADKPVAVTIYNRWEDIVFRQDQYRNDWRGTWQRNGQPLPDGTYYIVLELDVNRKDLKPVLGFTTIHR
jgi:hypothetical protein